MRTALFAILAALLLTAGVGDRIEYDQSGHVPMEWSARTEQPDLSGYDFPRVMSQFPGPFPYASPHLFDPSTYPEWLDVLQTFADSVDVVQIRGFDRLMTEGGSALLDSLRARNPDILVMSKFPFDHSAKWYPYGLDPEFVVQNAPNGLAAYQVFGSWRHWPALAPNLTDTAMVFQSEIRFLVNHWSDKNPFEAFDHSPNVAYFDSLRAAFNKWPNLQIDWMLIDHYSNNQNVWDPVTQTYTGEVDYDEDGASDYSPYSWEPTATDIRDSYYEWQVAHAAQLQRDMGDRVLITHNGSMNGAYDNIDLSYSRRLMDTADGQHFERNGASAVYSPGFSGNLNVTPLASILTADSLYTMYGHEAIIMEDPRNTEDPFQQNSDGSWAVNAPSELEKEIYLEQLRVSTLYSLLGRAWFSLHTKTGTLPYPWLRISLEQIHSIDAGFPAGPLLVSGEPFSETVTLTREYTNGYVTGTFDTDGFPTGSQSTGYDISWTHTAPTPAPADTAGGGGGPQDDPIEPLVSYIPTRAASTWTASELTAAESSVEALHARPYITDIDATLETVTTVGTWQQGSWDYNHFGKQADWYNTPGKPPLNYWSSRPAYRHASRAGMSYIYSRLNDDAYATSQARIDSMVRHLRDEQIDPALVGTGGFATSDIGGWTQWQWRPGRENPNLKAMNRLVAGSSTHNEVNSYATGRAAQALAMAGAYDAISGNGATDSFYSDPLDAAEDWFITRPYDLDNYFNEGANLTASALWAMCTIYNYDPDPALLDKIEATARTLEKYNVKSGPLEGTTYQDGRLEDTVGTQTADHDTGIYYQAINTMGFIQAYYTLNEAGVAFADTVLAAAKRSVNHIIETRSNGDGTYKEWYVDINGSLILEANNRNLVLPSLPHAIGFFAAYAEGNPDFNDTERTRLSNLLNEAASPFPGTTGLNAFYVSQTYRLYRAFLDGGLSLTNAELFLDP